MPSLVVLLVAALTLLGLGLAQRGPRGAVPVVAGVGLLAALVAALSAEATLVFGPSVAVDGWAAVPLVSLFLLTAVGTVRPAVAGALALALLAADGVGLVVFGAGAILLAGPGASPARVAGTRWVRSPVLAGAAAACLAVALLVLCGLNLRFAAVVPGVTGLWGAVGAVSAVLGAGLVAVAIPGAGGLVAVYLVGRLLMDLPGPVTPGWWGGVVLLLGAGLLLWGAGRSAAAARLDDALAGVGLAGPAVAVLALGAALLARGADLLPLASLAVAGGLLTLLAWGIAAALTGLCAGVVQGVAGGELVRLGGLLRRAPATGLAMAVGLLSVSAVPLTPGFAAGWLVLQGLMGAGRSGGPGGLLLVAGAVSALGLGVALLAAAAVRLAGLVLLGQPRSAKANVVTEPQSGTRLAMAGLVVVSALLGVVPGLGLLVVRAGVSVVAAGMASDVGRGLLGIGLPDVPGYAAPVLAVLVVMVLAAAVAGARGAVGVAPAWQGGFVEDGVGRGNAVPVRLERSWAWPSLGTAVLAVLVVALSVLVGWALR